MKAIRRLAKRGFKPDRRQAGGFLPKQSFELHQNLQRVGFRAGGWQGDVDRVKPSCPLACIASPSLIFGTRTFTKDAAAKQALKIKHPVKLCLADFSDQFYEAQDRAFPVKNMGVMNGSAGLHQGGE